MNSVRKEPSPASTKHIVFNVWSFWSAWPLSWNSSCRCANSHWHTPTHLPRHVTGTTTRRNVCTASAPHETLKTSPKGDSVPAQWFVDRAGTHLTGQGVAPPRHPRPRPAARRPTPHHPPRLHRSTLPRRRPPRPRRPAAAGNGCRRLCGPAAEPSACAACCARCAAAPAGRRCPPPASAAGTLPSTASYLIRRGRVGLVLVTCCRGCRTYWDQSNRQRMQVPLQLQVDLVYDKNSRHSQCPHSPA